MSSKNVKIPGLKNQEVVFTIIGTSPLVVHAFGHKAMQEILDRQGRKAKTGKKARDHNQEIIDSIHWIDRKKNITGFPAGGIKAAIVRGAFNSDEKMTQARTWFFIIPDDPVTNLVKIIGNWKPDERPVRVGNGAADIRFRPLYWPWKMDIHIEFDNDNISVEKLAVWIMKAGFGVGIGEMRPEKSSTGTYGTWKLETK